MKKILAAALIGTIVLSLAACGGKTNTASSENAFTGVPISSTDSTDKDAEKANANDAGSEEVAAPDFSGTYTEPMSGRCTIDITSAGNNNYKITIHWSSSAYESANWEIDATYYPSTTLLEYTNAKYFVRTYSSEEEYKDDVIYVNGAGEFWFEKDGSLGWRSANSDADGITGDTKFERIEFITE